jgi:predicted lysophospholipase L1 biosynthesis ABC-type transport system permease subunit
VSGLSESGGAFLIVYYTALTALTAAALYVREEVFKSTLQVAVFVKVVVTSIIFFSIAIRLKGEISVVVLMISGVMLAAMITILIDRYVKDEFLAISIMFAIASVVLAVGLILHILDKRSAQRKAQSIYFVEH